MKIFNGDDRSDFILKMYVFLYLFFFTPLYSEIHRYYDYFQNPNYTAQPALKTNKEKKRGENFLRGTGPPHIII